MVHRYIWECEVGPIPEGLVLDHQCRNRACCNVDHLRVVTYQVNSTENVVGIGWQVHEAKTHCPSGHVYDEANTYYDGRGRQCRACKNKRQREKRSADKIAKFRNKLDINSLP